ncbi:Packaging protein P20 [Frankliniella fusca]|uniref:Packaging protein P20 n=1 Tax=Frankliniella fusca TaxID=407009 RepID=A0AAE1LNE7_9NEOP|nr:Packaging protein P20 [Frankliniella fusca]
MSERRRLHRRPRFGFGSARLRILLANSDLGRGARDGTVTLYCTNSTGLHAVFGCSHFGRNGLAEEEEAPVPHIICSVRNKINFWQKDKPDLPSGAMWTKVIRRL